MERTGMAYCNGCGHNRPDNNDYCYVCGEQWGVTYIAPMPWPPAQRRLDWIRWARRHFGFRVQEAKALHSFLFMEVPVRFVNLTLHDVNDALSGETYPPSGSVARVDVEDIHVKGVFYAQRTGEVSGVPDPEDGVVLIVSREVRKALPGRMDLASPRKLIRDESGAVIGCNGFNVNWS